MSIGHIPPPSPPIVSSDEEEQEGFEIFVRNLDGKLKRMKVFEDTTVRQLKIMIQNAFGISPGQQILIFNGRNVNVDNRKLRSYGISEGSVIELMGRLRGG